MGQKGARSSTSFSKGGILLKSNPPSPLPHAGKGEYRGCTKGGGKGTTSEKTKGSLRDVFRTGLFGGRIIAKIGVFLIM